MMLSVCRPMNHSSTLSTGIQAQKPDESPPKTVDLTQAELAALLVGDVTLPVVVGPTQTMLRADESVLYGLLEDLCALGRMLSALYGSCRQRRMSRSDAVGRTPKFTEPAGGVSTPHANPSG